MHGITCTLVDPRPLKLNKLQHKQLEQAGRAAVIQTLALQQLERGDTWAAAACASTGGQTCGEAQQPVLTGVAELQQGAQQQVPRCSDVLGVLQEHCSIHKDGIQPEQQQQKQERVIRDSTTPPLHLQQVQAWFGSDLWCVAAWQQLFSDCSLVVGLHPDQATEPIVEFALQQQIPFAVMPCCVFPRLFPDRRLLSGGLRVPVISYEEFVAYLMQKGDAQRVTLDFEGANVVVYRRAGV